MSNEEKNLAENQGAAAAPAREEAPVAAPVKAEPQRVFDARSEEYPRSDAPVAPPEVYRPAVEPAPGEKQDDEARDIEDTEADDDAEEAEEAQDAQEAGPRSQAQAGAAQGLVTEALGTATPSATPSTAGGAPAGAGAPTGEPRGRGRRRRRGRGGRGGERQPGQAGQPGQQPQGAGPEGRQPQRQPGERQGQQPGGRERVQGERNGRGERPERGGERPERGGNREERGERAGREHIHRGVAVSKKPIKREVLANTSFEETRIAIVEDGRLAELHWERKSAQNIVGNIYKGQVENVLPGISSAFVNIGYEKNAYLYISDVLGERGAAIDSTLKKGQHIMVQVAKEAISTKGMKVTMDVSLPGRYLVFTPFQTYVGISKHIAEPEERRRLSAIVDKLVAEQLGGKGVVVRTEAEGASEADLEREVKYLMQLWTNIQKKFESDPPPTLLHKDLDLSLQIARDLLSDQVYVYLLDNKETFKNVVEFVEGISPELKDRVRLYEAKTPIFTAFHLEPEIEKLRKVKVPLPNGGSIVIQEAESLCAIDVNTGRFTGSKSQEETVTQTNIEAAVEVARQLRLRNIGGIVVVDFIDMRKASNRNKVMEAFAHAVKNDRAKIRILPITRLGLIEMTRERKRQSTVSLITDECPECKGCGRVLSAETIRIRVQREIQEMTGGRAGGSVRLMLHPALAEQFRQQQAVIEKNAARSIKIQSDPMVQWEDYRIVIE